MESSIKIDFVDNGNGLEPVIQVKIVDTDDPRDSLIRTFFQKLGGMSSWLRVDFNNGLTLTANKFITLYPVTPEELKGISALIEERLKEGGISSPSHNKKK